MRRSEQIADLMDSGLNCAEAMVLVFADDIGLPRQIGMRIATPFGAGMSLTNRVCGLVSGAMIVVGAANERGKASDEAAKERAYVTAADIIHEVEKLKGSVDCTAILGADLSEPGIRQVVRNDPKYGRRCRETAAEIVELLEVRLDLPSTDG